MVEEILGWGNGAHRQRKVWKKSGGDGVAAVDYVLGKTASSDPEPRSAPVSLVGSAAAPGRCSAVRPPRAWLTQSQPKPT